MIMLPYGEKETQVETKSKWPDKSQYKWRKAVTLTKKEGAALESIVAQHDCENISQLCKKIATQELELIQRKKPE